MDSGVLSSRAFPSGIYSGSPPYHTGKLHPLHLPFMGWYNPPTSLDVIQFMSPMALRVIRGPQGSTNNAFGAFLNVTALFLLSSLPPHPLASNRLDNYLHWSPLFPYFRDKNTIFVTTHLFVKSSWPTVPPPENINCNLSLKVNRWEVTNLFKRKRKLWHGSLLQWNGYLFRKQLQNRIVGFQLSENRCTRSRQLSS